MSVKAQKRNLCILIVYGIVELLFLHITCVIFPAQLFLNLFDNGVKLFICCCRQGDMVFFISKSLDDNKLNQTWHILGIYLGLINSISD